MIRRMLAAAAFALALAVAVATGPYCAAAQDDTPPSHPPSAPATASGAEPSGLAPVTVIVVVIAITVVVAIALVEARRHPDPR